MKRCLRLTPVTVAEFAEWTPGKRRRHNYDLHEVAYFVESMLNFLPQSHRAGGTMQPTEDVAKIVDGETLRAQSLNEFGKSNLSSADRNGLLIATALIFLF